MTATRNERQIVYLIQEKCHFEICIGLKSGDKFLFERRSMKETHA